MLKRGYFSELSISRFTTGTHKRRTWWSHSWSLGCLCFSAQRVTYVTEEFFGSESLALLPRILFASRREARRNFQHGAPSTKNDVPTHAQGRSKGISSFMIVRGKAIFHCYIYVAEFLVKKFNLWGICTQLNGRAGWHVPQDLSNFRLRGNCSFSRNAL